MKKAIRGKHTIDAYLAGIIDGEGSVFITRINNKKSGNVWYRLGIACAMTEKAAIELLRDRFTPHLKAYMYLGGRKKGYKAVYQWLVTGDTAVAILQELLPFMRVKTVQARLGIEFQSWRETLGNTGKARSKVEMKKFDKYYKKMQKLNGVRSRND